MAGQVIHHRPADPEGNSMTMIAPIPDPPQLGLDPERIRLVLHTLTATDHRCHHCGGPYGDTTQVHLTLGETSPATDTALCTRCVETTGDYGRALVRLRDGLEQIDHALSTAPDEQLHRLAAFALQAVDIQTRAHGDAERKRFIARHTLRAVPTGADQ